jgi:hypothetical protein
MGYLSPNVNHLFAMQHRTHRGLWPALEDDAIADRAMVWAALSIEIFENSFTQGT